MSPVEPGEIGATKQHCDAWSHGRGHPQGFGDDVRPQALASMRLRHDDAADPYDREQPASFYLRFDNHQPSRGDEAPVHASESDVAVLRPPVETKVFYEEWVQITADELPSLCCGETSKFDHLRESHATAHKTTPLTALLAATARGVKRCEYADHRVSGKPRRHELIRGTVAVAEVNQVGWLLRPAASFKRPLVASVVVSRRCVAAEFQSLGIEGDFDVLQRLL